MIRFITDNSCTFNLKNKALLKKWIRETIINNKYACGDITYIFCNDDMILDINRRYLKHDYYTDIISFDYSDDCIISGDIFISVDTVSSNALKYKVDFNDEILRVIIHGVLHFLGYKDKKTIDKKRMTMAENKAIKAFHKTVPRGTR